MTSNKLTQMALSAILRCKEKVDLFELNDILCGKQTMAVKRKGFDTVKTFGAGKMYTKRQWYYWLIQMIQQEVFYIDYDDNDYLKVLEKGRQVLNGELYVNLKRLSQKSLTIVRKGIPIDIDLEIQDSIDWRKYIDELNNVVYWNYKEERHVNVNDIIPQNIPKRDQVKAKYLEIASSVYNLTVKEEVIIIPKKVDRDMYGNEVQPLSLPFEDCLARLEQFVKTTGRYPQMNALAEEVALRKWYREVGHGIINVTPEQKELFQRFSKQYPMSQKSTKKD